MNTPFRAVEVAEVPEQSRLGESAGLGRLHGGEMPLGGCIGRSPLVTDDDGLFVMGRAGEGQFLHPGPARQPDCDRLPSLLRSDLQSPTDAFEALARSSLDRSGESSVG